MTTKQKSIFTLLIIFAIGCLIGLIVSIINIIIDFNPFLLIAIYLCFFSFNAFIIAATRYYKKLKKNTEFTNLNRINSFQINDILSDKNNEKINIISDNDSSNVCKKCGCVNNSDAEYCKLCHSRLNKKCPSCGKLNDPDAKFCNNCGYKF